MFALTGSGTAEGCGRMMTPAVQPARTEMGGPMRHEVLGFVVELNRKGRGQPGKKG
jgi:hypothetical protein